MQRSLEALQAALKERERRQGASIEEIAEELQKKKAALDTAKKELKALMSLNRALKKSVKSRLARWHEFRRHIALRCKIYFQYHLSNRGYFGKVIFDHVAGTLQLKVGDVRQRFQTSYLNCSAGPNGRSNGHAGRQPGEGPAVAQWRREVVLHHLFAALSVGVHRLPYSLSGYVLNLMRL